MTSTRISIARHEDGSLSLGTPHGRFDLDPRLFPELTWVGSPRELIIKPL